MATEGNIQQPAVTVLSLSLVKSPLTSHREIPERRTTGHPSGSMRKKRDSLNKKNQSLRLVWDTCNSLWDTTQNLKTNTTKTNDSILNHLESLMPRGAGLDAVPCDHSGLVPGPTGTGMEGEWLFNSFCYILSCHPSERGRKRKRGSPLKDSNLFIIVHNSLIVKASHRQEFPCG